MKFLKVLLAIIIIVAAVVIIAGLVIDSEFKVERSTTINGCYADVENQIIDFHNWENWSPWMKMASDNNWEVTLDYSEDQGQEGSSYSWESAPDAIGSGNVKATTVEDGRMDFHLTFTSPMEAESDGYLTYESTEEGMNVSWGMYGENSFIGKIFFSLMGQKDVLANDFDTGLGMMKDLVEGMEQPSYTPERAALPERHYLGHRMMVNVNDLTSEAYANGFGMIWGAMKASGLEMDSTYFPMAIFHSFDEATMDAEMELAFPINGDPGEIEGFSSGILSAGDYLIGEYTGSYDNSGDMWNNMESYTKCNNTQIIGSPYELYVVGPANEADTAKWITQVVYPVAQVEMAEATE